MPVASYILATAGHVDHGKSALVRALTGTDPDRLPEEKARGMTIDLGFAHLDLPSSTGPSMSIGIVDVPGHEDFIKNMVAGLGMGGIDAALLVVAADDGWMPQTEEHLQILTYLGVTRGVVALTKCDLASPHTDPVAAVRERLQASPLAQAPIIPTSIISKKGLPELRSALARTFSAAPSPRDVGKPRLPLDRVFTLKGTGTVVTGTLIGGTLHRGQRIILQPAGHAAHIRTIQTHGREVEVAGPGRRVALNLPELSTRDGTIARGDIVTLPGLGEPSDTLDILLLRIDRSSLDPHSSSLVQRPLSAPPRLRHTAHVWVHHGSTALPVSLHLAQTNQGRDGHLAHRYGDMRNAHPTELALDERIPAQIRLRSPIHAFLGDRLIIRDSSQRHTLAGGIVLDPRARRRGFRQPHRQHQLQVQADALDDPTVFILAQLNRDAVAQRSTLLCQSGFAQIEVDQAVERMIAVGKIVTHGELLIHAAWWKELRQKAVRAIDDYHAEHPERPGLELAALRPLLDEWVKTNTPLMDAAGGLPAGVNVPGRSALAAKPATRQGRIQHTPPALNSSLPRGAMGFHTRSMTVLTNALLDELRHDGFTRVAEMIRRVEHRPALPPRLQHAGDRLRTHLSTDPLNPPSRRQLAPDSRDQQALRFLLINHEAVELAPQIIISVEALNQAIDTIRDHIRSHGPATVSELKAALGSSRRIVVPLLEKLDRDGVTRREGDKRVLESEV